MFFLNRVKSSARRALRGTGVLNAKRTALRGDKSNE
jgi:hypothetical protein